MIKNYPDGARSPWQPLALPLILLAATVRHFASLKAPFFADDFLFLEQVRGKSVFDALIAPDPIGNFFRPVSRALYFWLVGAFSGESAMVFHLVNLALFLGIVVLLHLLLRRLAGGMTAIIASAYLALHYAADVPLLWASGSQDLLAIALALCALIASLENRALLGAVALGMALLSKETVLLTAPLAALIVRVAHQTSLRSAIRSTMPLFLVSAAWAGGYLLVFNSRLATGTGLSLTLPDILAGMWHLPQVALGWEFPRGQLFGFRPSWDMVLPTTCALVAVWLTRAERSEEVSRSTWLVTACWVVAGIIPLLLAASIWSAYFYLFALCGVALAFGLWMQRQSALVAMGVVAMLAFFSNSASNLGEFAQGAGAFASQSHVNRHSVQRSMRSVANYVAQLRSAQPRLPQNSTVFFANLPGSIGLQAADGPLLRWAYKNPSLRSYFLTDFTLERARRGPLYFFALEDERLVDKTADPMLLHSFALSMLLDEKAAAARDVLTLLLERSPDDVLAPYWLAVAELSREEHPLPPDQGAVQSVGSASGRLPQAMRERIERQLAAPDTAGAFALLIDATRNHLGDPWPHARLAALEMGRDPKSVAGAIEAYAYRVLAPEDADAWRKWTAAQLGQGRYDKAAEALEQYFALGGVQAEQDKEAQQVRASLNAVRSGDGVN